MAASDKELEEQLNETGNKLLNPPSSVEELLRHLDQVEECLAKVEQSPPDSMQNALSPLMKALVADKLFKHLDVDVKVAVAACISEITRITAPEAPYDDDQMREVFQLIVSSFDNLVDKSSRSYAKRTSILETVAKVRSCVVMLDLECDALIIEMFQHFLKAIRDHHPENVFSSMETIMTLVLEESEDVPPELLSPILDHVKKDSEVLQISRKLAEQVLKNCATKLKPYLTEAIKSSGLSLDSYSNLVASICQGTLGTLEQNDTVASGKEEGQKATEVSSPEQADAHKEGSLKTEVSNGIAQIAENDSLADSKSTVKHEDGNVMDEPRKTDNLSGTDHGDTDAQKVADAGQEQKQTSKKKGKKPGWVKQVGSSKRSDVKETESGELPDSKVSVKDVTSSPHDQSANAVISSENEKETSDQALASKPLEDETVNITTPSQSASRADERRSKMAVSQKKKESFTKEAKTSAGNAAKEASEEPSDSEAKLTKKSGKKVSSSKTKPATATKKTSSEAKPAKQSGKKAVDSDSVQESSKPKDDKKKQGRGEATDEKEASEASSDDDERPIISSVKSASKSSKSEKQPVEETPKTNAKRKHSLGKEKTSDVKECSDNLVGSRIKVWWPKDRVFYEGVVDSYDTAKKKHLVLYDDGDQEILNLKREKWELIEEESETTEDEGAEQTGPDAKSEMPLKKKAKTGEQLTKQTKTDASASAKKSGGASSSKSKAAVATKSGKKTKEDGKIESKSKTPRKPEDGSSEEIEDYEKPKPSGKAASSKPGSSGIGSKSKKEEAATTKSGKSKEEGDSGNISKAASSKKKEETAKSSSSKSKTEPAKPSSSATKAKTGKATSGKSNGTGTGTGSGSKPKSATAAATSSKGKEIDGESDAEDTRKTAETTASKGKSTGSAKAQAKSGKKRKR